MVPEITLFWTLALVPVVIFVIIPEFILYVVQHPYPVRRSWIPWLQHPLAEPLCRNSFPATITVMGLATWTIRVLSMQGYEFRSFFNYNEPRYLASLLLTAVYYFFFGFVDYFLIDAFVAVGIFLLCRGLFGNDRPLINRSRMGVARSVIIKCVMLFLVWVRLLHDIHQNVG